MKKIQNIIVISFLLFPFNLNAEDVFGISAKCDNSLLTIKRHNITQGTEEILRNDISCSGVSSATEVDTVKGLFYVKQGDGSINIYDYVNDTVTTTSGYTGATRYVIPYSSTSVSDMIDKKPDGSLHIGENSLVTIESGGRQQLYATDATGNRIDINIPSGTNLLIDGEDVMGSIDSSIALGAAFASLPTGAEGAGYTCGLGTGFHDSASAISGGCGFDFANYSFVDSMPELFQKASFNIGAASVVHGEGDDATLKAGITFKFGAPKPVREAKDNNLLLENKIDAVMAKNEAIQNENDLLKAQIAEINSQLKALNMLAMN